MVKAEIGFQGLPGGSFAAEAERCLRSLEGIAEAAFDPAVRRLAVRFDPRRIDVERILSALEPFAVEPKLVSIVAPNHAAFERATDSPSGAMSETGFPIGGSLRSLLARLRSVWKDGRDPALPERAKRLLEEFLARAGEEERWLRDLIQEGSPATRLYRDPVHGFAVTGHVLRNRESLAPHDHGPCWVLYGVYRGAVESTRYRVVEADEAARRARLEKLETRPIAAGAVELCAPGEIHSTVALEPSVAFRVSSFDLDKVSRSLYDPEKNTVRTFFGRCYLPC